MIGYLAAQGFLPELQEELERAGVCVESVQDRLILTKKGPVKAAWAQNIWLNPEKIAITSISDAAKKLRAIQRNWVLFPLGHFRRAQLIREKLAPIPTKSIRFPSPLPTAPLGSWTLLDENTLLASPACSHPFPNGEMNFEEDREGPPSRAYLKLWEAITLAGVQPRRGETCLDMGSSPGGWTWVLHELGAKVLSVDKAALATEIARLPRVESIRKDAFGLEPSDIGPVDWFCSDVICYPLKLFELVSKWLESGLCRNFVCTLKFQGKGLDADDQAAIAAFSRIPNSTLRHLFHNKHELTWMRLEGATGSGR